MIEHHHSLPSSLDSDSPPAYQLQQSQPQCTSLHPNEQLQISHSLHVHGPPSQLHTTNPHHSTSSHWREVHRVQQMIRQKAIDHATKFFFLSSIPSPSPQNPNNIHISCTPATHPFVNHLLLNCRWLLAKPWEVRIEHI